MKQENIEILLDQILNKIEKLGSQPKKTNNSKDLDLSNLVTKQQFDDLSQNQSVVINTVNRFIERFIALDKTVKKWQPVDKVEIKNQHFFFPDLKDWLESLNRGKINWILGITLCLSFYFNFDLYQENSFHKKGFLRDYIREQTGISTTEINQYLEKDEDAFYNTAESEYLENMEKMRIEREIKKLEKERQLINSNQAK